MQGCLRASLLLAGLCLGLLQRVCDAAGQASGAGSLPILAAEARLKRYMDDAQLEAYLTDYAHRCRHIAKLTTYGRSRAGRPLWALQLSSKRSAGSLPGFKYVGGLHGDEPSGRQLLLYLAEYLCEHHKRDSYATKLLDNIRLVLIPAANPDGYAARIRENSVGVDLNRDFPDPWDKRAAAAGLAQPRGTEQPETLALMNLTLSGHFVASASLHEGAIVANYPMDGYPDKSNDVRQVKQACKDDATFVHLAKTYAKLHTFMSASKEFPDGVTNGAQWYPLYGGMQDWNYLAAGVMEITLELSQDKWPPEEALPEYWRDNRAALLRLPLTAVLGGCRGQVVDAAGQPVAARVSLAPPAVPGGLVAASDPLTGHFFRPLPPGRHTLLVMPSEAMDATTSSSSSSSSSKDAGSISSLAQSSASASQTVVVVVPADGSGAFVQVKLPGRRKRPSPGYSSGASDGAGDSDSSVPDTATSKQGGSSVGANNASKAQLKQRTPASSSSFSSSSFSSSSADTTSATAKQGQPGQSTAHSLLHHPHQGERSLAAALSSGGTAVAWLFGAFVIIQAGVVVTVYLRRRAGSGARPSSPKQAFALRGQPGRGASFPGGALMG